MAAQLVSGRRQATASRWHIHQRCPRLMQGTASLQSTMHGLAPGSRCAALSKRRSAPGSAPLTLAQAFMS